MNTFVHLKVHTEYSMRDGILRIKPLMAAAKADGMSAIAITDHMNLCGMVKFYRQALASGMKPIFGADIAMVLDDHTYFVTLLCMNKTGYQNLTCLLSRGYQEGQTLGGEPMLQWAWIAARSDGLIALSGAGAGDIGQALLADKQALAEARLSQWQAAFPNRFYIELQRTGRPQESAYMQAAVAFAAANNLPVVATNNARFLARSDYEAHEARVCIHQGYVLDDKARPRQYTEQQYFRSQSEMAELFSDIPEALQNTVEIAKRCSVPLTLGEVYLPQFPVPDGMTDGDYLRQLSNEGLSARLANYSLSESARAAYQSRLELELNTIIQMGFPGYFLIVADFIRWAKRNGIPVGPGRGSGAGSLVAYVLDITTLDPLQHELLFERFLNPERVSMPDFDIDFCMERRDEVIEYVAQTYGRDAVSQIITYGSMAARAVLRDVGRVLGLPYGFCDKLAKLVPFEIGMTLDKAMQQEPQLEARYDAEEEVRTLIDLAKTLEGITRNAGKHAGGVVIAPGRLTDFTPLYCEADGANLVTQFDKDDVEAVGLVKFDFLGLRTLTIIDWALKTVNASRAADAVIDIEKIPLDDQKTFALLQSCATTAVFQLESRGMKELIRRLQPDSFEDITALVALFRPGPLQSGMVDDFIDRKHGRAKVHYPHPELESILQPTYGVILYQEQVMQIAQVLAGYTLGAADLLRRAMGKKKPEEMAKQRSIFVTGAEARGIESATAEYIFDLMEKFAGYGFNKSHSAAYALIAYQTAWIKAHYPAEFMAAVLSSDMDNTDKVVGFLSECEAMGLTVLPPDVHAGQYQFTVNAQGEIVYGLGAIKGAGQAAIECIVTAREREGHYQDLYDFVQRIDLHKVNRRVLEPLVKSGALDVFHANRAVLFASIDRAIQSAEQKNKNAEAGQNDLFGGLSDTEKTVDLAYVDALPWTQKQTLAFEKETLGFYSTGHPLSVYETELARIVKYRIADLKRSQRKTVKIAGILLSTRIITTKQGRRMAILRIEDQSGTIEVTLFSRTFDASRDLLEDDAILIIQGKVEDDHYTGGVRLVAEELQSLDEYRRNAAKRLVLSVQDQTQVEALLDGLPTVMDAHGRGRCPVVIRYQSEQAKAQLVLGEAWQINPAGALLEALEGLCDHVVLEY